ncbi:MAG: hypothetical protein DDT42_00457 [candidate division WS2 bacterium]|uniref:Uncharacterized protein n=1 Tax=Psychracetigena formicireducens TaxID=2986056 RepID=A0A9E2F5R2_PSYF1|nr:hypothetical protein [Candidatus Psychracetigena formicireducens]
MIKTRFAFLCTIVLTFLVIPLYAFTDADGFRSINWGTDISTLSDMRFIRTDPSYGGIKMYSRKNDELKIGGAILESIKYGFWRDKFSSVWIEIKGFTNFSALRNATVERFGPGDKSNSFIERYFWLGEKTGMILKYCKVFKEGFLFMSLKEIKEQQRQYEKDIAEKGAEKGF